MMKTMKLQWCLFPMACLLVVAAAGCEKEPPPPAKPKVVVKKIAVAPKASKAPAKPVPAKAEATKPAPAPAKAKAAQPASGPKADTAQQASPAKGAVPATKAPAVEKEKATAAKAPPKTGATQTSPAKPTAGGPATGAEKQKASGLSELVALNRPRIYDPKGRINPFTPLFEKKPEAEEKDQGEAKKRKRKVRVPQTPLEKVDLAQLKLVAIMHMQSGPRALVEESSGKGYVVRKGTYMGLHSGQVVEIVGDRVVVEEEVENLLGNYEIKKRELKLQKPLGD